MYKKICCYMYIKSYVNRNDEYTSLTQCFRWNFCTVVRKSNGYYYEYTYT